MFFYKTASHSKQLTFFFFITHYIYIANIKSMKFTRFYKFPTTEPIKTRKFHPFCPCNFFLAQIASIPLSIPNCVDSSNIKKSQTKITNIHNDVFELYQFFMNNFICQNISIKNFIEIYILHTTILDNTYGGCFTF